LLAISTPGDALYGKHLKRDELKKMLLPEPKGRSSTLNWLRDSGIRSQDVEDDGEWVNFIGTVSQAERMMNTTFNIYESEDKTVRKIRTLRYSIPESLRSYIQMIQPTTRFGQPQRFISQIWRQKEYDPNEFSQVNDTMCNVTIQPSCLTDLYSVPSLPVDRPRSGAAAKNKIAVTGFLEEVARNSDLSKFKAKYAPWLKNATFASVSVNGGPTEQSGFNGTSEANLDIQYALSVSMGVPTTFYSIPGRGPLVPDVNEPNPSLNSNEPYLEMFTYFKNLPDDELPSVISNSYGEDEQSVPVEYAKKICDIMGELGSRGVSVIFSSGDFGPGYGCQANDGKNTTRFLPTFPGACPWVTSVGGTTMVGPETAVALSSGGFSDVFTQPPYQKKAVNDYLASLGDKWKGLYNPQGRGFPDVSAQASRFHIFASGTDHLVSGTSASAPTFAGIVGLLNEYRLKNNEPKLGFLNPWLYSQGSKGFTDIVKGGSRGCLPSSLGGMPTAGVPFASWNATTGWDPVTGLGTPNFGELAKLASGQDQEHYGNPRV
jgi:tripeptidyl-peptidase I